MNKRKISWPKTLMLAGAVIWFVGEVVGANNKEGSDTTSEWYGNLPPWVQHLISFAIGGVCAHLWKWKYGEDAPTINIEGNATIDAHEEK